jgi:hypothetical protein
MRVGEKQASQYDEFDKRASTLSAFERREKYLEFQKAQAPRENEAKRLRAGIDARRIDLLKTIRRIDAESGRILDKAP